MIDLHCDTMMKLTAPIHRGNLLKNPYSVDVERLEKAGSILQCFSMFFDAGKYPVKSREERSYHTANRMLDAFEKNSELCEGRLVTVKKWEDIEKCMEEKKVGALLTLEDGVSVGDSMEKLHHFYDRGIRLITLTWNHENAIGYPNSKNPEIMAGGLKPFGFEMMEEMERLGMLVDVSHLSDGGFWDVARHSRRPFIASHSNARSITVHSRNLTDAMIEAIAEKGGVIGLNFCPRFLGVDEVSSISNMLHHIRHILQVGGEDVLALGTDLDGTSGKMEIESSGDMWRLKEALEKEKIPPRIIDKIWQGNALRVMKEIL